MVRQFIQWNKGICRQLEPHLPNARENTFDQYPHIVREYIRALKPRTVLDVGGGRTCAYRDGQDRHTGVKVFAVDISVDELQYNEVVDARLVVDVTKHLPFQDGSIDMITSRSVLEHLTDLEAFVQEASRVMRPGGYFVHLVPNRFAPFALINQMLPNKVSRRIVHYLHPSTEGICGFPAIYDHCYPSGVEKVLERHRFEPLVVQPAYYQSKYFSFFVPFYVASNGYELAARALGLRNLCAHFLLIAKRRA